MPLIGFSAQFIPYIMAMIFTMIFLNGNNLVKAEKQISKNLVVSGNHISFSENPDATPNAYHYQNHSNAFFAGCDFTTEFQNKRVCSLNPFYRNSFSQSRYVRAFPHRGPPPSLS